ncbi:MAG: MscL family protein [Bacilli bacterium]|jgi:large-conductance mechanosensitive channel
MKKDKAEKKAKKKEKRKGFWQEFKEFINRGNAFMLAVGVVIGAAFSAIVNAFVDILLSLATWGVPGGLKGLVTVLPAANNAQKGLDPANGLGQYFKLSELHDLAVDYADRVYGSTDTVMVAQSKTEILSKYNQHGNTFTYKMSAVIDWGALISAVISFLIVAIVLFLIVKAVNTIQKKNEELKARALEEYYKKNPEERPKPVEPGKPEPTEQELLKEIVGLLKEQQKQ